MSTPTPPTGPLPGLPPIGSTTARKVVRPPSGPSSAPWWNRSEPLPGTTGMVESERLIGRAIACESLVEALLMVAAYSTDGHGYVTRLRQYEKQHGLSVPHPNGTVTFSWNARAEWDDRGHAHRADTTHVEVQAARMNALLGTLVGARVHPGAPHAILRMPDESLLAASRQAAVALAMWWQERLDEGHTPESAKFLLSLHLSPAGLARVQWSTTTKADNSPAWTGVPVTVYVLPERGHQP